MNHELYFLLHTQVHRVLKQVPCFVHSIKCVDLLAVDGAAMFTLSKGLDVVVSTRTTRLRLRFRFDVMEDRSTYRKLYLFITPTDELKKVDGTCAGESLYIPATPRNINSLLKRLVPSTQFYTEVDWQKK